MKIWLQIDELLYFDKLYNVKLYDKLNCEIIILKKYYQ